MDDQAGYRHRVTRVLSHADKYFRVVCKRASFEFGSDAGLNLVRREAGNLDRAAREGQIDHAAGQYGEQSRTVVHRVEQPNVEHIADTDAIYLGVLGERRERSNKEK